MRADGGAVAGTRQPDDVAALARGHLRGPSASCPAARNATSSSAVGALLAAMRSPMNTAPVTPSAVSMVDELALAPATAP